MQLTLLLTLPIFITNTTDFKAACDDFFAAQRAVEHVALTPYIVPVPKPAKKRIVRKRKKRAAAIPYPPEPPRRTGLLQPMDPSAPGKLGPAGRMPDAFNWDTRAQP